MTVLVRSRWAGNETYMYPTILNANGNSQQFENSPTTSVSPKITTEAPIVLSSSCPSTFTETPLHWPESSLKMGSQFGEWPHGLNIGERPMVFPFVVLFRKMRILAESHLSKLKGLVCGTMFGSSAALPFLYPLDLKGLCLLDFGFFICSAILFAVLNSAEIAL
ncbi:hypothetical protein N431DRAFT_15286 [Stipitochalara longipes BDJ]|nr:hypothetical protein N431DRAFT_15286 [Stipitochalara longipes BDJ]